MDLTSCIYDSNDVTLDAMAIETQSEDTAKRYESYGWEVQIVKEGHDMEKILAAYEKAKNTTSGRPQFIVLKTVIAKGIPEVAGTNKGHGEAGAKFVDASRKALGLPDEHFFVSKATQDYFHAHKEKLVKEYAQWEKVSLKIGWFLSSTYLITSRLTTNGALQTPNLLSFWTPLKSLLMLLSSLQLYVFINAWFITLSKKGLLGSQIC